MGMKEIIFYILSVFILTTGVLAVTTRMIFRAAIWLLFTLIGIASLYFWMEVEFIAAVQIVVYVGGIVVLIIFSIFLTQQSGEQMPEILKRRTIPAALACLFGIAFVTHLIYNHVFAPVSSLVFDASIERIGTQLLGTGEDGFILPFEVISILLLAAMVGCIVIAMKIKKEPVS